MNAITWKAIGAVDHLRGQGSGKDYWHSEEWIIGPARGASSKVQFRRPMPDEWDYSKYSEEMDAVEDLSDEWQRLFTFGHLSELGCVYHVFDKEFVEAIRTTTVSDHWRDIVVAAGFMLGRSYRVGSETYTITIPKPGTKKGKVNIHIVVDEDKNMVVRYSAHGSRFSYIVMMAATHNFAHVDNHPIPVYPPNDNILGLAAKFLVDVLIPHFQTTKIDIRKDR